MIIAENWTPSTLTHTAMAQQSLFNRHTTDRLTAQIIESVKNVNEVLMLRHREITPLLRC